MATVGVVGGYDWDQEKEWLNARKHGVWFDEAETALDRDDTWTRRDPRDWGAEARYRNIGWSARARFLVVVTSEGGSRPRIISARRATKRERHDYARR